MSNTCKLRFLAAGEECAGKVSAMVALVHLSVEGLTCAMKIGRLRELILDAKIVKGLARDHQCSTRRKGRCEYWNWTRYLRTPDDGLVFLASSRLLLSPIMAISRSILRSTLIVDTSNLV